ncbi:MAG TPA: M24 family metallopeptidase [Tepidisphaeraceae bacterium]|nr:M24 family metallopeptidase [Tepidisphaeraceae bacterium]
MSETETKQRRLADYLGRHGLDGVLLQHRANFAWVTGGRDNHIANNTAEGVAAILATADQRVCLANNIEAPRMEKEEFGKNGISVVAFPWYDRKKAAARAQEVIAGRRIAADMDLFGIGLPPLPADFAELRFSLVEEEVKRYREGARRAARAMENACMSLKYGDSEFEVAGTLDYYIGREGLTPLVTLVASDERIEKFRHPIPTVKTVEHYVMLVTCAAYRGLISCLTRFVSFRPVPQELKAKVQTVADIDATINLSTRPGRTLGELFVVLQKAYADHGQADQWKLHHQGGPTGYNNREAVATPDSALTVRRNQAFAWNPSIVGIKSEDTVLCTDEGVEVLTAPSDEWPKVNGRFEGRLLPRADILVR